MTLSFVKAMLHEAIFLATCNATNVAMRLFSNRSQMRSKCGKNKKISHEVIAEFVTDVLNTF